MVAILASHTFIYLLTFGNIAHIRAVGDLYGLYIGEDWRSALKVRFTDGSRSVGPEAHSHCGGTDCKSKERETRNYALLGSEIIREIWVTKHRSGFRVLESPDPGPCVFVVPRVLGYQSPGVLFSRHPEVRGRVFGSLPLDLGCTRCTRSAEQLFHAGFHPLPCLASIVSNFSWFCCTCAKFCNKFSCVDTHIQHTRTHMCALTHTHAHARSRIRCSRVWSTHTHAHTHTLPHTHTHTHTRTHTRTHTYTHSHTHVHTLAHTRTHTHTDTHVLSPTGGVHGAGGAGGAQGV